MERRRLIFVFERDCVFVVSISNNRHSSRRDHRYGHSYRFLKLIGRQLAMQPEQEVQGVIVVLNFNRDPL